MNKYIQNYTITNDCMDINYRLRPVEILMYFQDSFARYLTSKHIGAFDIVKDDLYWVISEINVQIIDNLPFWSEEIEVSIWVSEITKLKIFTDFELKYKNKTFAKGNCCWFLLNGKTKRPVISDIVSDKMAVLDELTVGPHKKFCLNNTTEAVTFASHKTNIRDIDFNNHVNNKSYINLAEMTIPNDFRVTHELKSLSVKYCKESYLGDELTCTTYRTGVKNAYVNKIEKGGTLMCEINTEWKDVSNQPSISDFPLEIRNTISWRNFSDAWV